MTSDPRVEIWGFCPGCRKWFDCPGWFDETVPEQNCPACDREPSAIINRRSTILADG